ncbi:hypothetical protein [Schleiferia thermophila]|uniref:Uncharacterized protein n=1 Tax=Schleiferia thermophila TaxID=884107 RepID=A0A368ZY27_9FLAO|nr:hypothetical protein [Schleiferia thermophila]RCX01006.1 hypothetical protein DES35_1108 [Schleiferia thermophila]GCD80897.1 hypothetical protein JCM30197_21440 [Schleiferia thermophila]
MKAYRFNHKSQTQTYSFLTVVAVVLGFLIFMGMEEYNLSKEVAYLIVVALSGVSVLSAIKKASKRIEEVMIEEDVYTFYFMNKLKSSVKIPRKKVSVVVDKDFVEFKYLTGEFIGRAERSALEKSYSWEDLLENIE